MAVAVLNALGFDKQPPIGKLISVEEHHGSSGNFVLSCLMADEVKREGGICLVAAHNTFSHYHNVGTKLGHNLYQLQERGYVETVELLKLLSCSLDSECGDYSLFSQDNELSVKLLFDFIRQKCEKLLQVRSTACLVIDDLSDLLSMGVSLRDVLSLLQYCQSMLELHTKLSVIILTHVNMDDDEQALLSAGVSHVSDVAVTVSCLQTGHSADVSGALRVDHKDWDKPNATREWNRQNFYHFKLLDRQVKVFAPGNISS